LIALVEQQLSELKTNHREAFADLERRHNHEVGQVKSKHDAIEKELKAEMKEKEERWLKMFASLYEMSK
jgi:hypothetical protein